MVAGHFMETDKLDSPEDSMRSYRHRQLGETKGGSRDIVTIWRDYPEEH